MLDYPVTLRVGCGQVTEGDNYAHANRGILVGRAGSGAVVLVVRGGVAWVSGVLSTPDSVNLLGFGGTETNTKTI